MDEVKTRLTASRRKLGRSRGIKQMSPEELTEYFTKRPHRNIDDVDLNVLTTQAAVQNLKEKDAAFIPANPVKDE